MKALKIGGITLLALLGIGLILSLIAPKEMLVERSAVIAAPREVVFKQISTFEKRDAWSPWMKLDPNMKLERTGEDGTVGAISKWEGNDQVGKGQEELKSITPNERVESKLAFIEPWESQADTWLQLADAEGGTKVTWGIKSPMPMPMNIMALFMDMDAMMGKDFEKGLADLKVIAEKEAASAPAADFNVMKVDMPTRWFIALRETVTMEQIASKYAENLPKVYEAVTKKGVAMDGMPCGLYYVWDEAGKKTDMAFAIPVKAKVEIPGFLTIELPAGSVLAVDYYGPYEGVGAAHGAIDAYARENGLKAGAPAVEQYITDPEKEPDPKKWLTKVMYPLE
ncbi:MAG: SRPBCC family protein [Saprospiraceae bacterium]|nr:SRPBCC family protein [Saprospiraceae bacterium]